MANNTKLGEDWRDQGYPLYLITSRQELDYACDILDSATELENADPNSVDQNKLDELAADIVYAGERHWTFQWQIIVGAIISVFLLNWCSRDKQKDIESQQEVIKTVEAWQPSDTTIAMTVFQNEVSNGVAYSERLQSAAKYKAYALEDAGRKYYNAENSPAYYAELLKNQSLDEETRERYESRYKEATESWPKKKVELTEAYNNLNKLDFEGIQKYALEKENKTLEIHKSSQGRTKFWFWFLIFCIPLYIIACRPYGYTMNKYDKEARALNLIQKIGLWLSGGLVAVAGAIQFKTIITKYSDGSTTETDDGLGPAKAVTKIGLIIAAVVVFCLISCFIMAYATIVGLIRNYDWVAIFKGAKSRIPKKQAPTP